jgi:alkylation response protein AidB-like acyl-CoA dehydrogenase
MIDYRKYESAIVLNWYEVDPNLQQIAHRTIDPVDLEWCEPELRKAGALVGSHIAARAEATDKNPPQLVKFDRWGERADEIIHHPGAIASKRDAWIAGISGPRLRNEAARHGRHYPEVMTTALNYMLSQAETGMLCAIGMTSGVVALVRRYAPAALREEMLAHLTAEDFDDAWDGAMFMTEKTGGSDLSTLTTVARQEGDRWILNGSKWFCSNVDAGAIVTLARPEGAEEGLKGVALFLVPRRRADGRRNGIDIRRLKDKLGTRAVPTAEVDFVDAEAYLMAGESGDPAAARDGRGINRMMEMVNSSRHGVAVMGLGIMRRSFMEAAIFAAHRTAFGSLLRDLPMMRETLVGMVVELEAAAALVFASAAEDSAITRLLVPLAKLRATRRGVELASQAVEVHGGNGYIENWPVARQLRDAQCHTIWEGTENIICLDVLRALRSEQVMKAALGTLEGRLAAAPRMLEEAREPVARALGEVRQALEFLSRAERDLAQLRARSFANYLADVAQAALLFEEAAWELEHRGSARKAVIASMFVHSHLSAPAARGLLSRDRTAIDLFDPLTGYEAIDPARAEAALRGA